MNDEQKEEVAVLVKAELDAHALQELLLDAAKASAQKGNHLLSTRMKLFATRAEELVFELRKTRFARQAANAPVSP